MESRLSTIPEYFPSRAARLQSLYSDFTRQKQANSTAFTSNVEWWYRLLRKCLEEGWFTDFDNGDEESVVDTENHTGGDLLILHARSDLPEKFRWGGLGRPLALSTVLSELYNGHPPRLIPLKEFMTSSVSIYHTDSLVRRVAGYIVGKPLWWALEQLNIVSETGEQAPSWGKLSNDYVFVEILEEVSNTIISKWRESAGTLGTLTESLQSLETLSAQFASVPISGKGTVRKLSPKDMEVVVKYISRDKQLVVVEREVIKLVVDEEVKEVTAVDHGVLEMKAAVFKLEAQVEIIQARIERFTDQIKENLRQKRKTIALSQLRSKKALEEDLLPKRLRSLEMIQTSLDNIERARGDVEILKAYEISTNILRTLLSHPALQRENVEDTLESMREANEDFNEIDGIIRTETNITVEGIANEEELEEELEELIRQSERERKEKGVERGPEKVDDKVQTQELPEAPREQHAHRTDPLEDDKVVRENAESRRMLSTEAPLS